MIFDLGKRRNPKDYLHDVSEVLPMFILLYEEATEEQNAAILGECLNIFDLIFEKRLGSITDIAQIID